MVDLPPRETGTIWSTCSLTPSALPRPHLTLTLALGLLMLSPEHIEHGLYAERYDGKREERHHGIDDLIHTYPFSTLMAFHAKHTEPQCPPITYCRCMHTRLPSLRVDRNTASIWQAWQSATVLPLRHPETCRQYVPNSRRDVFLDIPWYS